MTRLLGLSVGFNQLAHASLSGWRQTVRVRQGNFVVLIHLSHSQSLLSSQGTGTTANSHRRSKRRLMNDRSLPTTLMTYTLQDHPNSHDWPSEVMLTNDFSFVLYNIFPAESSDIPSVITNIEILMHPLASHQQQQLFALIALICR